MATANSAVYDRSRKIQERQSYFIKFSPDALVLRCKIDDLHGSCPNIIEQQKILVKFSSHRKFHQFSDHAHCGSPWYRRGDVIALVPHDAEILQIAEMYGGNLYQPWACASYKSYDSEWTTFDKLISNVVAKRM